MKTFILNTDLLYYASRYEEDVAFTKMLGNDFKTSNNGNKASKIIVDFNKPTDKLHIYTKPRFMIKDYYEDPNSVYIGIFSTDDSIKGCDFKMIEEFCKEKNIIPIFSKRPAMGKVIKEILEGKTYRHVFPKNQSEMWQEFYAFNQTVADKLVSHYDKKDTVWIQDHNCFLVPQFIENKNIITSFNLPFSALIVSVPYYKQIMANLVKNRAVSFYDPSSKLTFKEMISQFIVDTEETLPLATCHSFGTDVDFLDKAICSEKFQDCDLFKGVENLVVLPYNSPDHLLCIEAYLSRYEEPINVVLLNLGYIDIEKQTEVQRIVEHLKITYRLNITSILPKSDIELFKIISNSKIGLIQSLKGYFYYFNKHYITENIYDYEEIATRIYCILKCKKAKGKISKRFADPGTAKRHLTTPKCIRDRLMSFARPETLVDDIGSQTKKLDECGKNYPVRLIVPNQEKYYDIDSSNSIESDFSNKTTLGSTSENSSTIANRSNVIEVTKVNGNQSKSGVDHIDNLISNIKNKEKTVLLLDYDGTLTPIVNNPDDALPSDKLIDILRVLNKKENIKLYIVTGRSQEDMDRIIPKDIDVFAEHGAFQRKKGKWSQLSENSNMNLPYRIAEFYHERTPKSTLEKKVNGFVFHYRNCDFDIGEKQAMSLMEQLKRVDCERTKCGKKIVEFRSCGKNQVFDYISADLIIAAGDDTTDEDMFDHKNTISIKVGKEKTKARYFVDDVNGMISVLDLISKEL